jgi:hypothetical protein
MQHAYVHSHINSKATSEQIKQMRWAESRNFAFAPTHTGAFPDAHSAPFLTHFAKVIRFCDDVSREMCVLQKLKSQRGKRLQDYLDLSYRYY